MKRALLTAAAAFVCIVLATHPALAKPSMQQVLAATFGIRDLSHVGIAPDASAVVWQESFREAPRYERRRALYVQMVGESTPTRITAGNQGAYYDEQEPTWSADGKRIAFLSDARSPNQLQLFIGGPAGEQPRELTHLDGFVQSIRWSPDGRSLAALYIPHAHRKAGALAAGARDVGVIGSVVDEQRLALIDAGSGATRLLTPSDVYVYEYCWSPDSHRLAATYAHGNGDNNWWIAKLAVVDAATGHMRELFKPKLQIDDPEWSPDGKQIAVIHGLMSDFGATGGDVDLVDAATGAVHDATPGMKASASALRWADWAHLDMSAHVAGTIHLLRLDVRTAQISTLVGGDGSIPSWSSARRGAVFALSRTSFDRPDEVWMGSPSALKQVTRRNAGAVAMYGSAKSIHWTSDGFDVQGWLVYPLRYDPRNTYPMVTIIHGGPSAESIPAFGQRNVNALGSHGYFVFLPNPRGSFGQGEAFTAANVKDFGYGDWRDDLAGIDAALKTAPIDKHRLGLFGWSYGGYMAMWAETQTSRFKALVAGAGLVNWQSYYGQNKIDQWMIPFFGASVYDDPQVYAKSSPITFIKRSKTPVLILQGELDEEVPAPQSFEFWHAMTTLGVPTQLVVYADEGHSPQKAASQIDILERMVGWFDRYLR